MDNKFSSSINDIDERIFEKYYAFERKLDIKRAQKAKMKAKLFAAAACFTIFACIGVTVILPAMRKDNPIDPLLPPNDTATETEHSFLTDTVHQNGEKVEDDTNESAMETAEDTVAETSPLVDTTEAEETDADTVEETVIETESIEEVTTSEEETLDEFTAAIKECRDILEYSQKLQYIMLTYYDNLMSGGNDSIISFGQVNLKFNNYKDAIEHALHYQGLGLENTEKYEKLVEKVDEELSYLVAYYYLFLAQEISDDEVTFNVSDVLSIAAELENKIYNAHNAIETIAKYEGDTIVYADDDSKNVFNIVDIDSYSDVTKNAIESVILAYNTIYLEVFAENENTVQHSTGTGIPLFAKYDQYGNIPDPDDKETYYVLFDDGIMLDGNGNDISKTDVVFTGTDISNYRYFEIVDVSTSSIKVDGKYYYDLEINGEIVRVNVANLDGGRVIFVPITETAVTETIYRNINNAGTWYYYSKDADGNILDYYVDKQDGTFAKVVVVDQNAIPLDYGTIKALLTEDGSPITDINGNPLYVSGKDHNSFVFYSIKQSALDACNNIMESLNQLVDDIGNLGHITSKEFLMAVELLAQQMV